MTEAQKVGEAAGPATTEEQLNGLGLVLTPKSKARRALGKFSNFLRMRKS